MPAQLQNNQIRYDPHPLELRSLSFGTTLVHLRMPTMQAQDLQTMHGKGSLIRSEHFCRHVYDHVMSLGKSCSHSALMHDMAFNADQSRLALSLALIT